MSTTHLIAAATAGAFAPGRSWSVVAVVLGLTGAIVGGRALARGRAHREVGFGRGGAVALVTGLVGVGVGGLVVVGADGGPGTGSGIVGGLLAVVIGLAAVVLGGLVLTLSRRAAAPAVSRAPR